MEHAQVPTLSALWDPQRRENPMPSPHHRHAPWFLTGILLILGKHRAKCGTPTVPVANFPWPGGTPLYGGELNADGCPDVVTILGSICSRSCVAIMAGSQSPTACGEWGDRSLPQWPIFTGDGLPDLITARRGLRLADTITVWVGRGDGTFALPQRQSIARDLFPQAMTTADLNTDGQLDLIVWGDQTRTVMLFGRGDGTFTAPQVLAHEQYSWVTVADLTADNRLVLLAGGKHTYDVVLLRGRGNGAVARPQLLDTGGPMSAMTVAAPLLARSPRRFNSCAHGKGPAGGAPAPGNCHAVSWPPGPFPWHYGSTVPFRECRQRRGPIRGGRLSRRAR